MADEGPREVHVRIEHREGRQAVRLVWLAAALIFVAMIKPWPQAAPAHETSAPVVRATPAVTVAPEIIAAEPCTGSWWSVEVDEAAAGPIARVWVLTDAVEAVGPLDARIRFVTIASQEVIGLGFCPPFHDVPAGGSATFFRLDPGPSPFKTTAVSMPRADEIRANTLYRPSPDPGAAASGQEGWPAGRYVMRIDGQDGYRRWLGLDVRLVSLPGVSLRSDAPPG